MTKNELVKYLRSQTIFSDLKVAHVKVLAEHVQEKQFAAGDLLFRQEDPAESFYIVREGSIKVEVPAINGPSLEVQTLGADDVLGWSWLMPPYRWTFQALAETDSTLLMFDGKALLARCEKDTDFGYALMKRFTGLMQDRLHAARIKIMESWAPAGWA